MNVTVIGAGLAGSECAWQLAQRGIQVELHEMKPEKMTPAHTTEYFAELCCSNSLRGAGLENAVGLLKEELRRLDSLILQCADATRVEAGGALAVDRHGFARLVTEKVRSHPNITVIPGEVTEIPEGEVIIASGPLTSDALAETLRSSGLRVQLYCEQKKFKQKMAYADKLKVPFAVLLGEDEIAEGKCSVKDMKTGEQLKLTPAEAAEHIKASLDAETGTLILEK